MQELDRLIELSESHNEIKHDFSPASVQSFNWHPDTCQLVTPPMLCTHDGNGFQSTLDLTEHAFTQACDRLGAVCWPGSQRRIPAKYLLACPSTLRARNMNHWTERAPENRKWFVRGIERTDLEGNSFLEGRAILTDRYSVVDVLETLQWIKQILEDKGNGNTRLHNSVVTEDILHMRILFQEVNPNRDGPYGIGTYITTGEIGNRRIGCYPYIQRTSCTNSIVGQKGSWQHTHTGDSALLRQEFLVHMLRAFEASENLLATMLDAENKRLPNFSEIITDMCERQGWGESVQNSIFTGSQASRSVFGVVNGLSFAAQDVTDQDQRANMEMLAGEFLETMMAEPVLVHASR